MNHSVPAGGGTVTTFEKPIRGHWRLRKLAYATTERRAGKGCYFDEHQLVNVHSGQVIERPAWEWADVDRDRLVWVHAGCLYAGYLVGEGLQAQELFDFNPLQFARLTAPY